LIRKILYPLSLIYGLIMKLRNWAFDKGIIRSKKFSIPTIVVGNLNVGGTGKSPQIEYLIRLLSPKYDTAVLSRGYGRKSKGFLLADKNSNADLLGDEPLQFYRKFSKLCVAVDENRVHGIEQIQRLNPNIELILLDDAFQHRYVDAGLYILLTAFGSLYMDDHLLPSGNLRESKNGAKRAQLIVVTKCPQDLNKEEQAMIVKKLKPLEHQQVFFSAITYGDVILGDQKKIFLNDLVGYDVLLVTGIANPQPIEEFLNQKKVVFDHLKFADHQRLGNNELKAIYKKYIENKAGKKLILTTEKDYVRNFLDVDFPVYYLPIQTELIGDADSFNKLINHYVRKNKGNC
jgi:tetraacyldisaccharide 4'-kinase